MEKSNLLQEGLNSLAERLKLKNISEALVFPKYFEIETIRACNARCKMCTIPQWKDKNSVMSEELFDKIVKEIAEYKEWINTVCLSRNGEPLLDKNLTKKIKKLKECGIKNVTLSTNASLLNKETSLALINSGLDDIMFSIDGSTKSTFESIRKGLNFETVISNCLKFIELRNANGKKPSIRIRMVLQKANQHEEQDFKNFWLPKLSKQDIAYSKAMNNWGNQLPNYEGQKNEVNEYSDVPCVSPWSTVVIHFDGKVPLCGCDFNTKMFMGDLNKSTIKTIWRSEKFEKIREIHSSGKRNDITLCQGCNVWDLEKKKVY